jgi:hypothetical protein
MTTRVYFHIYYFLLDNDRQILKRESEICLQNPDLEYMEVYFHTPYVLMSCCLSRQMHSVTVYHVNYVVCVHP